MSTDGNEPNEPEDGGTPEGSSEEQEYNDGRLIDLPIEDELKDSYLTYAMSVIVSRALPDVRDGLKPSQRRILVAMNDLNLGPNSSRVKCAKISGDTSGNYHPHGESVIYPTLVRMAQEWNMRHPCLWTSRVTSDRLLAFRQLRCDIPKPDCRHFMLMMLDDLKLRHGRLRSDVRRKPNRAHRPCRARSFPTSWSTGRMESPSAWQRRFRRTTWVKSVMRFVKLDRRAGCDCGRCLFQIIKGPDFPTGGIICGRKRNSPRLPHGSQHDRRACEN